MLISLTWLKKYVDVPADVPALVHDLTMAGVNVEKYVSTGMQDKSIIIGRVLDVSKHPNADKLSLCRVQVNKDEVKDIICGASNVASGQFVPVALVGSTLPDGTKIKKSKIRGVYSEGMICSERELGLGEDAAGIMVLQGDFEPGLPAADALPPNDTILEIEVTPNRPDLLSHVGVAREVAAIYKTDLNYPGAAVDAGMSSGSSVGLEVENGDDCPRYVGRIIRGVKVSPSPPWLAQALEAVGINSINNIVDITNFVMMELGQPLHAFAVNKIHGSRVVVRKARDGESLAALDGETYQMKQRFLVIANDREPMALAGIIGGMETAVTESTRDVFLECACFDPKLVRRTRKELNINTEASYRFERGSDREICRTASDRACSLITEVAGGEAGEILDVYGRKLHAGRILLKPRTANRLLGVNISPAEAMELLEPLGFDCKEVASMGLSVAAPSFRADITEEADLIEEIARRYGYGRIGRGWDFRCTTFAARDPFDEFVDISLDHLASRGFTEVITSAFTDASEVKLMQWVQRGSKQGNLKIRNPLVSTQVCMRTSLVPGMLEVLRRNIDQGIRRINICQAGKIFLPRKKGLPEERFVEALVMTRPRGEDFWLNVKKESDLFDIKREIEIISHFFKIDIDHYFCYDADTEAGRFGYSWNDEVVIGGGIADEEISKRFDFDQPIWFAEIDLERFFKAKPSITRFKTLPEFPVSKRDLSLLAKPGITYEQIEKTLAKIGGGLVESFKLFDVYRGDRIPEDTTAYGIRIEFRSSDKTLTDAEIDALISKMLIRLKNDLDVEIRA